MFDGTCVSVLYRNQAYQTRVQLAVLDYNSHLSREKAKNKDGIQMYNRKFRKQTCHTCVGVQEISTHSRTDEGHRA